MTTFADKILSEPCEHEWYVQHSNWCGTGYYCIYCNKTKYIKNEPRMTNC